MELTALLLTTNLTKGFHIYYSSTPNNFTVSTSFSCTQYFWRLTDSLMSHYVFNFDRLFASEIIELLFCVYVMFVFCVCVLLNFSINNFTPTNEDTGYPGGTWFFCPKVDIQGIHDFLSESGSLWGTTRFCPKVKIFMGWISTWERISRGRIVFSSYKQGYPGSKASS